MKLLYLLGINQKKCKFKKLRLINFRHGKCIVDLKEYVTMDTLAFSTKARNLEQLVGSLTTASILPLYYFSRGSWEKDPEICLANIHLQIYIR